MHPNQQADDWYDQSMETGISLLETGNYAVDPHLLSQYDNRYGISLLIRPAPAINLNIQDFLDALKKIDPNQYYYPSSDIHVTVLTIISCLPGFQLNQIQADDYINLVANSLYDCSPFQLEFKGVTLSSGAVLVRGHPVDDQLNHIRENIRTAFKASRLLHSIDERYTIITAHSSVVRYQYPIENIPAWIYKIREFQNYDFGMQTVDTLELVFNDWFMRKDKVRILKEIQLHEEGKTEPFTR
ncbi:hypothetical protein GCM10027036_20550 [Flavihumibacter cheonanensis]|uniref:2'-5' RNA ligase family protein n=1 Tax=Flavihumibacter cheonanensis TaxID=1442385 RepID=UPI001EF8BDAD|nr:hypothetical protein [Flavihumibacter cheonanensis]MCG7754187.1 hypothetical protein [Flavihumibacter cheonanensis]